VSDAGSSSGNNVTDDNPTTGPSGCGVGPSGARASGGAFAALFALALLGRLRRRK
jgi:MYXO-CTERM domain-containing protein